MPREQSAVAEERVPLTREAVSRSSIERSSIDTTSTTSFVLETLSDDRTARSQKPSRYTDEDDERFANKEQEYDVEDVKFHTAQPADKKAKRLLWILAVACVLGWTLALVSFLITGSYKHPSSRPHDPLATVSVGSGKKITLDQWQNGVWSPRRQGISWISGANGEDGLLLERGMPGNPYLVVEAVKHIDTQTNSDDSTVLMNDMSFTVDGKHVVPNDVWPSPDLKKVLVMSDREKNWRHSSTGLFWILDVASQTAIPLDNKQPDGRVQTASWSPNSDAVVFTRDNNMYLRRLNSDSVEQITKDGGPELFYGVPDWVYEEEVFSGSSATWWSEDGEFIAFLRTNESTVPTYPVQYFLSRPSGKDPVPGQEFYPEVREIKYPKAGAPNPVVNMLFYDLAKKEVFSVQIDGDFDDDNRLITEVVWAGRSKQVLVRETNRESDFLKLVLIDVQRRTGKTVRNEDVSALDGGWFEVSQDTTFIPSDPASGRNHDGYIDTVVHDGYDHLAYFSPLDNDKPIMLTSGNWEVVSAPSAIDLKNNLVYFMATKDGPIQRHAYHVKLDGSGLSPVTDTSKEGYYDVSFSKGAGYALVSYNGPNIPWQKVISTPSNTINFEKTLEKNEELDQMARTHELPLLNYETFTTADGFELDVLERRPPHFSEKKKYPVLFQLYNGPNSQEVTKRFRVDFQSYIASSLGYVVVTVDGRGTGFRGRAHRVAVRGNLGHYEALDQIAVAKEWAKKKYIDAERVAIWGWSYGGFMTLKVLETDAGETFKYGMAVAPVTDWRLYGTYLSNNAGSKAYTS